jgi:plasmid stabilization system protein ParE
MFEVIWLPVALNDLNKQFEFLNEINPDVASRATRAILTAGASLANFPERGKAIPETDQRKLRVSFGKYGYLLYYRVEIEQVFILRVHHGREDPKAQKDNQN